MTEAVDIAEFEALHNILASDGWRVIRNMAVTYKQDGQKDVNSLIRAGKYDQAREALAKIDAVSEFIDKVKNRKKELESKES